MVVNSIKFLFYLFGLQIEFKFFPKIWHVIPLLIPLASLYLVIFVFNEPVVENVSDGSHLINLGFISIHQVSYVSILLEANLKSKKERLICEKIEKINEIIQFRFKNIKKCNLLMKNVIKGHIPVCSFLLTMFIVNYLIIINVTRFVTDWALLVIPRLVFYLFCVQMIIYISVVGQKLQQIRLSLEANGYSIVLDDLEEVYIEVWELSEMINNKFQISFGVVLLQLFLDMTICAFWGLEYLMVLHPSSLCEYVVEN